LRGRQQALSDDAVAREPDPRTLEQIDEVRREVRNVYGMRWVRSFDDPKLHDKIDAGNEVLGAWLALFDHLRRYAEAPSQWTKTDREQLDQEAQHLLEVRAHYFQALFPKKDEAR
jgi:hypothetical protein